MKPEEFGEILANCLVRIQQGQASVEQVLAEYPELASELAAELSAAAWIQRHGQAFEPRPGFVSASRRRLINQIEQEKAAQTVSAAPQQPRFSFGSIFKNHAWALRLVVSLVVVAFLFTAGSGVSYATRSLVPGDSFYSLKLTIEKAQLAFTLDEGARADLRVELVQRRMAEINSLALEGQYEQLPASAASFKAYVDQATQELQAAARVHPATAKALGQKLDASLKAQGQMVKVWSQMAPATARTVLAEILTITEAGSETVEGIMATATATLTVTNQGTLTPTPGQTATAGLPGSSPLPGQAASVTPMPPTAGQTPVSPSATPAPPGATQQPALPAVSATPQAGATTVTPEATSTKEKPTARPTNTHRPTQKPDDGSSTKPTKEAPATKEPRPTKEPKPTKSG